MAYLEDIYGLRKRLTALREGSADYGRLQATGGVLAFRRTASQQQALVLISFNRAPVVSEVRGGVPLNGSWRDERTGTTFTGKDTLRVSMDPFEVRVLTH